MFAKSYTQAVLNVGKIHRAIHTLYERKVADAAGSSIEERDLISQYEFSGRSVAREFLRQLRRREFTVSAGLEIEIPLSAQKRKSFYLFPVADQILIQHLSLCLEDLLKAQYPDCLYSYRQGVRWSTAVREVAAFVRQHPGTHLIKCDVASYTETIRQQPGSLLRQELRALLFASKAELNSDEQIVWDLLMAYLRPVVRFKDGTLRELEGLPSGTPLCAPLYNFYLLKVDHHFSALRDQLVYVRYSDDIILGSHDRKLLDESFRFLESELAHRKLELSAKKTQFCFLDPSGFARTDRMPYQATQFINYLGVRLDHRGEISLKLGKQRAFLTDVRRRLRAYARTLPPNLKPEQRAPLLTRFCNRILQSQEKSDSLMYYNYVRQIVTSRNYLAELDYQIALLVLREACDKRSTSPKVFRQISYRRLRQEFQLTSLVNRRNRG